MLFGPSIEDLRPWVVTAVEIFGASRCMFATDFPIDRLVCSFGDLVGSLQTILSGLGSEQQSAFFSGCATQLYRL